MAYNVFTPMYIDRTESRRTRDLVTSADWNELFNLNITQGDHSEKYLSELSTYLFGTGTNGYLATLQAQADATQSDLSTHKARTDNPHSVIANQINNTPLTLIAGTDVQTVLANMDTAIGLRETSAHAQETYETITTANGLIKNVILNPTPGVHNGVLRFIKQDNTYFDIDTNLEKVVTNFTYDPVTKKLKLFYPDGTFVEISLADLIDVYTFNDSATIDFTVTDHNVTAAVKDGSITINKLESGLGTQLRTYSEIATQQAQVATSAAQNANSYKTSSQNYSHDSEAWAKGERNGVPVSEGQTAYQDNSKFYKEQAALQASAAAGSAVSASNSAGTASTKASVATEKATIASEKALVSEGWAEGKQNGIDVGSSSPYYHNNAKYWAEYAETAGDADRLKSEGFANGTQDGVIVGPESPYYHNNAHYWRDQAEEIATGQGIMLKANYDTTHTGNKVDTAINAEKLGNKLPSAYILNPDTKSDNQVLTYDAANQVWVARNASTPGMVLEATKITQGGVDVTSAAQEVLGIKDIITWLNRRTITNHGIIFGYQDYVADHGWVIPEGSATISGHGLVLAY